MSAIPRPMFDPSERLELHSGDQLTRRDFHRIYEQAPEDFKAELIGGTVYVASPLKRRHGKAHLLLGSVFAAYEASTPGVDAGDNTTVFLAEDSEAQPDLLMRILPECGGQSRTTADDYVEGAPELVAEISHSSYAIDLHAKREEYQRHGVREYVVWSLHEQQVRWFDLRRGAEGSAEADGVLRSFTFPGLWIDTRALLASDHGLLMETLKRGLASAEHAGFVQELSRRRP